MIWKLRPIISAQNWIKKSAPSPPHEEADGKAVGSIINNSGFDGLFVCGGFLSEKKGCVASKLALGWLQHPKNAG
jgi:hypothetical protein